MNKINYGDKALSSLIENCKKIDKEYHFYIAFSSFIVKDFVKCKKEIRLLLQSIDFTDEAFSELEFAETFLVPFKNAFEGFWSFIADELSCIKTSAGLVELCSIIDVYYHAKSNDEAISAMLTYIQQYPDSIIVNELIGYTYYEMAMWNNAIAYFERLDNGIFFYHDEVLFMVAYSYGKIKNHIEEEHYYRKCIELSEEYGFDADIILNNLGYCLYQQKKYVEAAKIFKKCIDEKKALQYTANNYIRVLLANEQYSEAKKFIDETDCKISKSFKDRVEKGLAKKAKNKNSELAVPDILEEDTAKVPMKDIGIKREQFTNEKLLEDELTARIESGIPVFGLNLKIYKRRGEYGRQYIIPVGRLDLLCEDDKGNLYVIELKKDSGYDDAYKQTAEYLDWFAQSEKFSDKTVKGIICLNNPSPELISKVHKDERMRLFEYQISYTER